MTGMTMKYLNRLHRAIQTTNSDKYINSYRRTLALDKYQRMNIVEISEVITSLIFFNRNQSEVIAGKIYALTELKYAKQIKMEAVEYERNFV